MVDNSVQRLIFKLLESTRKGSTRWGESANDNEYISNFKSYSVAVGETPEVYYLSLLNDQGKTIEYIGSDELLRERHGAELLEALRAVYESARRTASGADEAVKSILDELGDETPDKDDDIPF